MSRIAENQAYRFYSIRYAHADVPLCYSNVTLAVIGSFIATHATVPYYSNFINGE
jgi:hypothetical protein